MGYRILALTENTIGAQLLLSAPLETLGHQVTVLLRPEALTVASLLFFATMKHIAS